MKSMKGLSMNKMLGGIKRRSTSTCMTLFTPTSTYP